MLSNKCSRAYNKTKWLQHKRYTVFENDGWAASDPTGRVHSLRNIYTQLLQGSIPKT